MVYVAKFNYPNMYLCPLFLFGCVKTVFNKANNVHINIMGCIHITTDGMEKQ